MSNGLSMASINKIKELASKHEYSLAVEILDSQDLEKSYNPQFLRLCGEIYENVGRLSDARHLYVKAHTLAPEATRIIYSLINFYLKVGYFGLADRYFEEYVFFTNGTGRELINVKYIMKKAKAPDLMELYDMIFPYYRDNMDEEWSFELLILSRLLDKGEIDIIASDYKASFKTSPYLHLIDSAVNEKSVAWDSFFIYAEHEVEDVKPEEQVTRELEEKQLEQDYYKMNPPEEEEAVITGMVTEDEDAVDIKSIKNADDVERGLKSFIRKRFKRIKKEDEEEAENPSVDEEDDEADDLVDELNENVAETDDNVAMSADKLAEIALSQVSGASETAEQSSDSADSVSQDSSDTVSSDTSDDATALKSEEKSEPEPVFEQDFVSYELDDGFAPESETIAGLESVDDELEDSAYDAFNAFKDYVKYHDVNLEEDEFVFGKDAVHRNEEPFVSPSEEEFELEEAEEEFELEEAAEAEEEFVPEVEEEFDTESVVAEDAVKESIEDTVKESIEDTVKETEEEFVPEVEEEFVPEVEEFDTESATVEDTVEVTIEDTVKETAEEFVPEVEEEFDTESVAVEDAVKESIEDTVKETEEEFASKVEEEFDTESAAVEDTVEVTIEDTVKETEEEFIPEVEEEFVPEAVDKYDDFTAYGTPAETKYEEHKYEESISDSMSAEPVVETIVEETATVEPAVEPVVEETATVEPAVEPIVEETATVEPAVEPIVEETATVEPAVEPVVEDSYMVPAVPSYMKDDLPSMDMTHFSSDLFPGLNDDKKYEEEHKETKEKFDKVAKEESSKLDEGLKEEEAKLREAEALLASLGIKL